MLEGGGSEGGESSLSFLIISSNPKCFNKAQQCPRRNNQLMLLLTKPCRKTARLLGSSGFPLGTPVLQSAPSLALPSPSSPPAFIHFETLTADFQTCTSQFKHKHHWLMPSPPSPCTYILKCLYFKLQRRETFSSPKTETGNEKWAKPISN